MVYLLYYTIYVADVDGFRPRLNVEDGAYNIYDRSSILKYYNNIRLAALSRFLFLVFDVRRSRRACREYCTQASNITYF